jgi:hypothetical protein
MAVKTVLIGTPRKDGAGSPGHEEWTTGDTPQDPDGNVLLTDAAGAGSPVSGLKGATVIASGTTGNIGPGTRTRVVLNTGAQHRYFLLSAYHATPSVTGGDDEDYFLATRRTGGSTQHVIVFVNNNDASNITVTYKVYRIDES